MAVPSSGTISLFGIAKELELDNYSSSIPVPTYSPIYNGPPFPLADMSTGGGGFDSINTDSSAKPDGSTPHAMSEFYSYDHDAAPAAVAYNVYLAEDWQDGDIGTGTRDDFSTTDFENSTLYSGGGNNVVVGTGTSLVEVTTRPSWTTSPTPGVSHPTVTSDQLRMSNSTNPHGMFIKTSDYDFGPATVTALPIANVPTTEAIAWRLRFQMSSPNNKDAIFDIRM